MYLIYLSIILYIYICRLARCLFDLHQSVEADKIIKDFQQKFPEYASNSACKALKMDIKEAIDSGMSFFITLKLI